MPESGSWRFGDIVWPNTVEIQFEPTTRQRLALSMGWKRELLFGGAAGGGKSVYLLAAACQYLDWPEYRALILRRTFPQLAIADGLLDLASSWFSNVAEGVNTVSGHPTRWIFPSGARIDFGHCQYLKDRTNYQGGAYHFVGFDELTQFLEGQFTYIAFSRQRRNVSSQIPIRVRCTSNPGGEGHEWVRDRYLEHGQTVEDTEAFLSRERAFLPSKIRDNPHLDAEDYEASLSELHPYEREMLMEGNWDVRPPGSLLDRGWFQYMDALPGKVVRRVRFWDLAATAHKAGTDPDWTVGTLGSQVKDAPVDFVVEDVERFRAEPGGLEHRIQTVVEADGPGVVQVFEQEPGSSGKIASTALARRLQGYTVFFDRPTGNKAERVGPFASAAKAGLVGVLRRDWLFEWLRELEMFDGTGSGHDDQVDSASGLYSRLAIRKGVQWSDLYSSPSSSAS